LFLSFSGVLRRSEPIGPSRLMYLPGVAGHNNYSIFEIYRSTLTVGQTAVIHYLKQSIKYVRMCFSISSSK
jgi:hypothetical protein